MKYKLILLALAIGLVFNFSACSDDDDDNNDKGNIVGTWKYSKVVADFKTNKPEKDAVIKKAIEDMFGADTFGEQIEFKDNGKVVIGDKTGDYSIKGNKITILQGEGYATTDYVLDGKKLVLYMGANTKLEELIEESEDLKGVVIEKAVAEINYTKQ